MGDVFGGDLKNGVTRVLTEIATASLHPNFPPRTGVARMGKTALPDDDFGHDKRSWFSLTGVISHESPGAPSDELDAFAGLYRLPAPKSADEGWERLSDWLTDVLDRWIAREPDPGDVPALNWMLRAGGLANDAASPPEVAVLVSRYRETEARIGFPRSANGMDERGIEPLNYRLNVRGNVDEDGPEVPRGFLEVFGKLSAGTSDFSTSGRLELANFLGGAGIRRRRAFLSTGSGNGSSVADWSTRRATSASSAVVRRTRNCSTGSRSASWRRDGPRRN